MINLCNSYIFIGKTKKEFSISSKNSKNSAYSNSILSISSHIYNIFGPPIKHNQTNTGLKTINTYEITVENQKYNVNFIIYNINHCYYLDIHVYGKTTHQIVTVLENIQDKIIGSDIEKQYIMIISYDSISEYYCNKAYPKLNKLERNLRKLLLNTYTINFEIEYYQKTISPDLQNKIKGVIQAKGNEEKKETERLKKFFYSMELSDIQTLLFTKKWTKVEEENKEVFLSKHEKLTELSEEELRTAFYKFSPHSDWERLFADKIDKCNTEEMLEKVRKARNDIAHCKFFYKEQYNLFNQSVRNLNRSIINAINLTEEKDFTQKQIQYFDTTNIRESFIQMQKQLEENVFNICQTIFLAVNECTNKIRKNFSNLDFSKFEETINKKLIDKDNELENSDELVIK